MHSCRCRSVGMKRLIRTAEAVREAEQHHTPAWATDAAKHEAQCAITAALEDFDAVKLDLTPEDFDEPPADTDNPLGEEHK